LKPGAALAPGSKSQAVLITIAFLYIYIAWGCTYMAIHVALASIPPFPIVAVRFLIAGSVLLLLLRVLRAQEFFWGSPTEWRDAGLVALLLLGGGNGGLVWAQQYVTTSVSALIFGLVPLCIILFDWLRPGGNPPGARVAVGLLFGFLGLFILIKPAAGTAGTNMELWGKLVIFGAACSWALGAICSRYMRAARGSPLLPMARQMILGGALFLIVATLHQDWRRFSWERITPASWLGFGYLVLFGSLLGYTTYVWLMRVTTPARAATIGYVNIVVAVLVGWTWGGEPMTLRILLGALVILGSVLLVLSKKTPVAVVPAK
jgi:drug/metabolite transporter (DMT)-like permease